MKEGLPLILILFQSSPKKMYLPHVACRTHFGMTALGCRIEKYKRKRTLKVSAIINNII
jgi:hypothetical protein